MFRYSKSINLITEYKDSEKNQWKIKQCKVFERKLCWQCNFLLDSGFLKV